MNGPGNALRENHHQQYKDRAQNQLPEVNPRYFIQQPGKRSRTHNGTGQGFNPAEQHRRGRVR